MIPISLVLVHLDQLHIVQVNPGVALGLRVYPIAAVKPQVFQDGDLLAAVIGDSNRSFGLSQMHGRGADLADGPKDQNARRTQDHHENDSEQGRVRHLSARFFLGLLLSHLRYFRELWSRGRNFRFQNLAPTDRWLGRNTGTAAVGAEFVIGADLFPAFVTFGTEQVHYLLYQRFPPSVSRRTM